VHSLQPSSGQARDVVHIYMQDGDVVTAHRLIEAMPFAGALNEKMWL